jgi:16S rRNA (cytosine967-C5)-methyltransferase
MTPAARIQATIDILDGMNASGLPADRFIRDWFRTRRYAGSKDRAAVAERVYDIMRHRASYAWRMQSEAPRALALASVVSEGADVDAIFSGGNYAPPALSEAERAIVAGPPQGAPPLHVQYEFPAFLEAELSRSLGDTLPAEMRAMLERAPVDLRVNTLKAARDDVLATLRDDNFDAHRTPHSPLGIRIAAQSGLSALRRHRLFEEGAFEFQDEASQIVALLVNAKPGERILDLAAGAGGKALALAAAMQNDGEIVASDIDAGRLLQIGARATRAGATIIRTQSSVPDESFDAVLIDAPCSGSGAWRRQPEQKWRLTSERLAELTALQDRLLKLGAARVQPGGRLVYVTCSLLACENEERIVAFLAQHPQFTLRSPGDAWHEATGLPPLPGMDVYFRATPATTSTDGFFAAILVHEGGADAE